MGHPWRPPPLPLPHHLRSTLTVHQRRRDQRGHRFSEEKKKKKKKPKSVQVKRREGGGEGDQDHTPFIRSIQLVDKIINVVTTFLGSKSREMGQSLEEVLVVCGCLW